MRSLRRIILSCLFATLPCIAGAQSDSPSKAVYMIRCSTDGWKTEISVNGVPVLKRDKGTARVPIENLVVNGPNKIAIKATQSAANAQPLTVVVLTNDVSTGVDTTLSRASGRPGKAGTTVDETIDFQGVVPMQWVWVKAADVRVLTTADQDAIYQQVKHLADCLNAKDLKTHNQLRGVFLDETAQFEGMDRAKVESMSDDMYKKLFTSATAPSRVKNRNQLSIEPFGRIAVVSAREPWPDNWTITMPLAGQQDFAFYDLLFSKIDGKWTLIN